MFGMLNPNMLTEFFYLFDFILGEFISGLCFTMNLYYNISKMITIQEFVDE